MLAMIIRNFMLCKKQLYFGVVYIILYSFMFESASMVVAGSMFIGLYMFSITLFSYEERSHSLSMNKSLPVGNGAIVGAYYIASAIYSFALLLLSLAVIFIIAHFDIKQMVMPTSMEIGTYILIFAVILSVQIPLIIKFGAMKLRWINMFILAAGFILIGALNEIDLSGIAVNGLSSILISLGLTIALVMISHLISVRIYEKKESD